MIKMKSGTCGVPVMHGDAVVRVERKTPNDEPFSLSPEAEARLVERKVAIYVNAHVPIAPPENHTEGGEGVALEDMKANDLRALGKEYGLSFAVGMKKADMIEAIKAAQSEGGESEEPDHEDTTDGEDDEGGEPAPTFDPSEAVQ